MDTVLKKFPNLLHGGDYNPDQWLAYPEVLKRDIELMKEAHVNAVSVGIFAWSALEPEEGIYHFEWLQEVIDNLYAAGIYTVLATPSAAMPAWLNEKYPETMQVDANRVRHLHGRRHNFCMTSPVMREKTMQIDRKLAERFGNHPGVILWHISNEMGGNGTEADCHCPLCQEKFREWLKAKYKTLDALNHAWWATFWSHTYTSWEQIESPAPHGETLVHGQNLDWKRFTSQQMLDFYNMEADTVRKYGGDIPITTNMMYYFKPLDYFKFSADVDIVSWDSYPNWHTDPDEVNMAVKNAGCHNIMRSLKKAPFLLMESTPSVTNWKENNIQKRPGLHMLSSMQAVALGSNSVQYFQWRKSRGSSEKFHGAVVGHSGRSDTREFREAAEVGARLEQLTNDIYKTVNKPQVAVIFDWENWWAVDDACGPKREMDYVKTVLQHYKPFWTQGVDVDFIDMDQDISSYKLVIAPMIYMIKENFAENVHTYVKNGGTFVTTYWSGIVNETDLCHLGGFPGLIRDVMGILEEEIDAPNELFPNSVSYRGKSYPIQDLCDIVRLETAQELASYEADYYAGTPALTKNTFGDGTAYYIASRNDEGFQQAFYGDLISELDIARSMNTELPYGVTVNKREGADKTFLFVQNFNASAVELKLDKTYAVAETGETVSGTMKLDGYSCTVLAE